MFPTLISLIRRMNFFSYIPYSFVRSYSLVYFNLDGNTNEMSELSELYGLALRQTSWNMVFLR